MKDLCSIDACRKVRDFILEKKLIKEKDRVIAAVSGGADSVFMLYSLIELKKEFDFNLSVCHFNHLLRPEADNEERFVKFLAESFSLNFYSEKGDVKRYAEEKAISIEMAARDLRYRFFKKLIYEDKGDLIALAHNLTDSIETFFLNIDRGTGIRGLKGILPQNGFFIRPILCLSNNEVRKTLNNLNIEFKVDSSNANLRYKRNAVRSVLIKNLQKVFGKGIEKRFYSLFENISNSLKSHSFFIENSLKENAFWDNYGSRVKLDYLKNLPDFAFYEVMLFLFERVSGSTYKVSKKLLKDLRDFVGISKSATRSLFPDKTIYAAKTKGFFYLVNSGFFKDIEFNCTFDNEIELPLGYRFVFEERDNFALSKKNEFVITNKTLLNSSVKVAKIDYKDDYLIKNGKKVNDLNKFLKKRGLSEFERKNIFVLKKEKEILFIPFFAVSDKLKQVKGKGDLIKVYMKDCLG